MSELLDYLRSQEEEILATIKEAVEIESPSDSKAGCDVIVEYFKKLLDKMDLDTEIILNEDRGNILKAVYEVKKNSGQILILAHLDTVWPVGTVRKRKFKIERNKAYGPGIYDMKTGAVQAIYALKSLLAMNKKINKRIVSLFTTDEEIGSSSSRCFIEAHARKSDVVLVLEPSVPTKGDLKTSRKGVGSYNIKVTGISSHAGSDPEQGVDAIMELCYQIIRLKNLSEPEEGTTVSVGKIQGGTKRNIIADLAEAEVDVRITLPEEGMRVDKEIKRIIQYVPRTKIEINGGINRPPMVRSTKTGEYFETIQALAGELGIDLGESSSGGGSDGNFTAALGIPTIDGLGAVGDGAHSNQEHILVPCVVPRTALIARILETF